MSTGIKVGTILAWKGGGLYFTILSLILSLVDKSWGKRKWKPWHLAFVSKRLKDGDWEVCEATWPRVRTMPLSVLEQIYSREYKIIDWFGKPVSQRKASRFVKERIGAKYDVRSYFWTIIQYILYKYLKLKLPRFLDDTYYCWELTEEFCAVLGKPWANTHSLAHKYPLISEFMNEVETVGR